MKIAIISVTKIGDVIAKKIRSKISSTIFLKSTIEDFNLKNITKNCFENYEAIIFISSTGIAVRGIKDFITKKDKDPAVLVIDSTGKFVISLLSGHLGGANKLTEEVSSIIKAQPIITTATDNLNLVAPDIIAKENNLVLDDLKIAKDIAALLVNNEKVAFIDEDNLIKIPKGYINNIKNAKAVVYVTNKNTINTDKKYLKLIRKNIILGIGCRKDYDSEKMKNQVIKSLKDKNIDIKSIKSIVSVDIKKEEEAIIKLSHFLNCEFKTYTIEAIKTVDNKFEGSSFVEKSIGVRSVCEPCVFLEKAKIIYKKEKLNGMTLAIGQI